MKFKPFDLEYSQSVWEQEVDFNLTESGVHPISLRELIGDNESLLENLLETLESADLPSLMSRWRDLGFVLDYAVNTLASVPLSTNANQSELRAPPIQVR